MKKRQGQLHKDQLGNTLYRFFVNERGELSADYQTGGVVTPAVRIKGVPSSWQRDLGEGSRLTTVRDALEHSFFTHQHGDVVVNPRGLGGWTEEVHAGFTHKWCLKAGFGRGKSSIVATACEGVDHHGTDPVWSCYSKEAQGWHFYYDKWDVDARQDGDERDSRIRHAVENLNLAIKFKNSPEERLTFKRDIGTGSSSIEGSREFVALSVLGEGLHPLQDIFAHTKMWVTNKTKVFGITVSKIRYHREKKTDNIKEIDLDRRSPRSHDGEDRAMGYSQRFTNTKLLSQFYLRCYSQNKTLTVKQLSNYVCRALESARFTGNTAERKGIYVGLRDELERELAVVEKADSKIMALAKVDEGLKEELDSMLLPGSTQFRT